MPCLRAPGADSEMQTDQRPPFTKGQPRTCLSYRWTDKEGISGVKGQTHTGDPRQPETAHTAGLGTQTNPRL